MENMLGSKPGGKWQECGTGDSFVSQSSIPKILSGTHGTQWEKKKKKKKEGTFYY